MSRWLFEQGRPVVAVVLHRLLFTRTVILVLGAFVLSLLSSSLMPRLHPTALAAPAAEGPSADPASTAVCGYGQTHPIADVQEKMLTEASALVASQRRPGLFWTVNDSKNEPMLFALDQQGRSQGRYRVPGADNLDWESLQLGPGRDGAPALYIGDTGDNKGKRRELAIYRVPEPDTLSQSGSTASTAPAERFRFVYPRHPRNTEALLVHPTTGEILMVTKEPDGNSLVFRMPMPLDSQRVVTVEPIATIAVSGANADGNLVTDASVAPDARLVTVRTYTSALEYDVAPGASLASIWTQSPRVIPLDDGSKAEGLTYRVDGGALITIGEGAPARLFETARQC